MLEMLTNTKDRIVGIKQVLRAAENGELEIIYIARDADLEIREKVLAAAEQFEIRAEMAPSKAELGRAAGIDVEAACAALKK